MPLIHARELRSLFAAGPQTALATLREGFSRHLAGKPGGLRPEDVSLRDLAEAAVENGREWLATMDPRNAASFMATEATTAVNTTAFVNVNGLIVQTKIMERYNAPEYVLTRLIPVTPSRKTSMKMVGAGSIGEITEEVHEGHTYPTVGFGEDWAETPETVKKGAIVNVTKEAVLADDYGMVLSRAADIGDGLALNTEKELTDLVFGLTNTYVWLDTTYNTYRTAAGQTSGGQYLWLNDHANPFTDYNDVDDAAALFEGMVDPHTGEKIVQMPRHIVIGERKQLGFSLAMTATGVAKTANSIEVTSANPLANRYQLVVSPLAQSRLVASGLTADQAKEYWIFGDVTRAFGYLENWPVTTVTAPAGNEAEFTQDIVARYKASKKGVGYVADPRKVVRNKNS